MLFSKKSPNVIPEHFKNSQIARQRFLIDSVNHVCPRIASIYAGRRGIAGPTLHVPAPVALRHNPLAKTCGDRIKLTGLAPKAVVGAYMHKLAMLIHGVLRSGKPFDVDFEKKKLAFQDGI